MISKKENNIKPKFKFGDTVVLKCIKDIREIPLLITGMRVDDGKIKYLISGSWIIEDDLDFSSEEFSNEMEVHVLTAKCDMPGESSYDVIGVYSSTEKASEALYEEINKTIKDWNIPIDDKSNQYLDGWSISGDDTYCHIFRDNGYVITHDLILSISPFFIQ